MTIPAQHPARLLYQPDLQVPVKTSPAACQTEATLLTDKWLPPGTQCKQQLAADQDAYKRSQETSVRKMHQLQHNVALCGKAQPNTEWHAEIHLGAGLCPEGISGRHLWAGASACSSRCFPLRHLPQAQQLQSIGMTATPLTHHPKSNIMLRSEYH